MRQLISCLVVKVKENILNFRDFYNLCSYIVILLLIHHSLLHITHATVQIIFTVLSITNGVIQKEMSSAV